MQRDIHQGLVDLGFDIHISTVAREMKRLGLTYKKASKQAAERNNRLRSYYSIRMSKYRPEQLVFLDESYKDDRTVLRNWGWGYKGRRACVTSPFV
jgi:hypothetical protein